ncbi:lipopolysaccharide biosynthesis protein [Litoribacter populi]|uniref:lipopolysaccharide biosynthesis protein n=1 Tax=Litoribacter populi TaxID=2598460 RepID=UPI00117F73D7|nr:polysaccharide biosynthesis C-terminal domain-containing protein [Litoribacter populi]
MSQLKKLAGQTAVYGISSILGKVINFFLIPMYTAYLPKEDVGAFTNIYAAIAFLNIIFTYGMETAYFRFSTGKGLDPQRVFSNVQSLILTTALSMGAILFLSADYLANLMEYPGQGYLFQWVALILTIDAVLAIPFAKLRAENRALTFALVKLFNIGLNVGFNLLLIAFSYHVFQGDILPALQPLVAQYYDPSKGIEYILLANLLANALLVPLMIFIIGKFRLRFEKEILQPMWHYAVPLLFMGLAGVTNEVFSRLLFEYVLPEDLYPHLTAREAGGIFGATFKLAIFMNLIIQAFKFAAEPFFFNQSQDKNSPALFAKVMHWFVIFCTTLMIAVAVNLNWIGPMILRGEGYMIALDIVPVLLVGYLFLGIYYNLSIWFKLTDQTKYSFYITLLGAVITIIIIVLVVPVVGFMGGALSTLACYLSMTIVCYYFGQKYFPIPYQTGRDLTYVIVAIILSYAGFYLNFDSFILTFLAQNSFILLFLGMIALLEKKELYLIVKNIKK